MLCNACGIRFKRSRTLRDESTRDVTHSNVEGRSDGLVGLSTERCSRKKADSDAATFKGIIAVSTPESEPRRCSVESTHALSSAGGLGLAQTCIAVQGVAGTGGLDPSSVKGGWEQCHRVSISNLLADDATCYYSELLPACRESKR